jgi:uncharacterized coiled-coil protein SlyX
LRLNQNLPPPPFLRPSSGKKSQVGDIDARIRKLEERRAHLTGERARRHGDAAALDAARVALEARMDAVRQAADAWVRGMESARGRVAQRIGVLGDAVDVADVARATAADAVATHRSATLARTRRGLVAYVNAVRHAVATGGELLSCKENRIRALGDSLADARDELDIARLELNPAVAQRVDAVEKLYRDVTAAREEADGIRAAIRATLDRFSTMEHRIRAAGIEYTHPADGLEDRFNQVRMATAERQQLSRGSAANPTLAGDLTTSRIDAFSIARSSPNASGIPRSRHSIGAGLSRAAQSSQAGASGGNQTARSLLAPTAAAAAKHQPRTLMQK